MITRPYDEDALPTYEQIHATIKPTWVLTPALQPTQSGLDLARLLAIHRGDPVEGPDPCPHIVRFEHELFIHNGHHRWVLTLVQGIPMIRVRLVDA